MVETSRRSLLLGLTTLIAAPAIVRASSLMPVKPLPVGTPLPFGLVKCTERYLFVFTDIRFVAGGNIHAGDPVCIDGHGNAVPWRLGTMAPMIGVSATTCSRGAQGTAITMQEDQTSYSGAVGL